jgi:hypothetical protein
LGLWQQSTAWQEYVLKEAVYLMAAGSKREKGEELGSQYTL